MLPFSFSYFVPRVKSVEQSISASLPPRIDLRNAISFRPVPRGFLGEASVDRD